MHRDRSLTRVPGASSSAIGVFVLLLCVLIFCSITGCVPPTTGSGTPDGQPPSGGAFLFNTIYFFALIYFGYYVMVLLPRTRAERDLKSFIETLKAGDEVVTDSGFVARFVSLSGEIATIELDRGSKVRILSSHLSAPKKALTKSNTTKSDPTKSDPTKSNTETPKKLKS